MPIPHAVHDRPPVTDDTYPGLHRVQLEEPEAGATCPAEQDWQETAFEDVEYVPAAHTLQAAAPAAL